MATYGATFLVDGGTGEVGLRREREIRITMGISFYDMREGYGYVTLTYNRDVSFFFFFGNSSSNAVVFKPLMEGERSTTVSLAA